MMKVTRLFLALGAIPLSVALVAGCGGDDDDDNGTETPATTSASPSTTNGTSQPGETPTTAATTPAGELPEFSDSAVTLDEGLRYEDIVEGSGPAAVEGQRLTVHYTLYFTDGTRYQSSLDGGQPYTFILGVGQVIRGWDLGLEGMKEGSTRALYIPSALAYGSRGQGAIGPDTDLVFVVELLQVQ